MAKKKKKRKSKFCDPSACDECVYVGDGGFMCTDERFVNDAGEGKIVVEDFVPTEHYMQCQKGGKQ